MRTEIGVISFAHMHAYEYAGVLTQLEEAEFVGIADEDASRGREAAEKFGTEFLALEELLERATAVIVCSETRDHRRLVEAALERGVHVLCEKPLATTAGDGRAMIAAAERAGKKLCTAFPVRYLPAVRQAKAAVDAGAIGRALAAAGTNHGKIPGGWFMDPEAAGGGAVMDHTVHLADVLRWMFGTEVASVYAEVGTFYNDGGVDDAGILTLELENGMFATIDPSWSRGAAFPTWGDVKLQITGTKGVVSVDAFEEAMRVYDHDRGDSRWIYTGDNMNEAMIRDFLAGVQDSSAISIASGLDGLRALEVALAAYESARTGEPVELSSQAIRTREA